MDVNRMALMHLSLEGIFQAKQCLILQTQSEIKYNTMRRLKTKLILLDFRYPKTYEAWVNHILTLCASSDDFGDL